MEELLAGYRAAIATAGVVPEAPSDFLVLLDAFLLEKVLYELRYELNNRPDWVAIPLRGLSSVLGL